MESAQNKLLLLFFVSGVIGLRNDIKSIKSNEICVKLTERPFFTHEFIFGPWRAYYTWGKLIRRCESIKIKTVSDTIKERFAHAVRDILEEEPDWSDAELLVVMGKERDELLMFPQGNVSGRYRGLINNRRTKRRFADRGAAYFGEAPRWYDAELVVVVGNGTGRRELLMFAEGSVRGRYKALINPRSLGLSPPHYGIKFMQLAFKGFNFFKYLVLINCSLLNGWLMARPNDTTVTVKEVMTIVDSVRLPLEGHFSCLP